MRGIWVSVAVEPPEGMSRVLAHRGPVSSGPHVFESPAGAVHLWQCAHAAPREETGREPWRGRFHTVFDGCLYNREELSRLVEVPPGATLDDSELMTALFSRWGAECLSRVNGMFALVIWDDVEKRLFAARDRFGLKPLYIYKGPRVLAFASEIKQFLPMRGMDVRLNARAGLEFLVAGLTDHSDETLFQDVLRVPGSTCLQLDLKQWRCTETLPPLRRWYELPEPGSLRLEEPEAVERFRDLLLDAVRVRWAQPGPRGLCLSGGLDSSAIAALLTSELERSGSAADRLVTFKAYFDDPLYDEPHLLKAVLESTGAIHHRSHCHGEDAMNVLDPLVWHMDEPFGRASLAAQWMLFEQAEELGIRSTLDGQGSDELLAGYMSMVRAHQDDLHRQGAGASAGLSSRSSLPVAELLDGRERYSWLTADLRERAARLPAFEPNPRSFNLGELCGYRVFHGDLPMMMRHNDRIGMAHGVETHVPFMDHRVVDFCIGLGGAYKIIGDETKYLLRRAMQHLLPPIIIKPYGKGSYSSLEEGWFRGGAGKGLKEGVLEVVRERPELFDVRAVEYLAREPARADKEVLMLLWRILCFGLWMRKFRVGS
ncbi:asparagine synthase [Cystobacter fuscus]|uniref:asparagine synthase (glutamine-hydrolyzing) n=1 Tax=Cystobacter fuscus TaxID=43 RepID=A0A250JF14_9BACT|nr:asparagine synthase (glutamine-hydrolyzing) [Cystobacter fuscus]ATB42180.1 asparagine synthase [Cystobacter fuscus]